jgi:hypothetical protein
MSPSQGLASRIYRLHFHGNVVYANGTYLNQPEGIKTTVCGIRIFTNRDLGLDDGYYTDFLLYCFILVSKYLGLNQDGGANTGIVGF